MTDQPLHNDLHTQIVNNAYVLYEAIAAMQNHGQNIHEHCQKIIKYIQEVKQGAAQAHLTGLEEICRWTEKNLRQFETIQDSVHRQAICTEIERWPRLISNYLYALNDEDISHQLINYMVNPHWPEPLLIEKTYLVADLLRTSPAQKAHQIIDSHLSFSWEEEAEWNTDHPKPSEPLKTLPLSPHEQSLEIGADDYHQPKLSLSVPALPEDSELEKMLDEATFEESVSLFEEDIPEDATTAHLETFSSEEENASSEEEDEEEEPAIFEEILLEEHLHQSLSPPAELSAKEKIIFPSESVVPPSKPKTFREEAEKNSQTSSLTELSNKIVEISGALSNALNQFVASPKESEDFLQSIEKYTDIVQSLWETTEKLNLKSFQKICTFVNDNMFEATSLSESKRLELHDLFASWPKLVLDCLQNPEQNASSLVEHFSAPGWILPLSKQQTQQLLTKLTKEAMVPKIVHISGGKFKIPTSSVQQEETEEYGNNQKSLVEIVILPGSEHSVPMLKELSPLSKKTSPSKEKRKEEEKVIKKEEDEEFIDTTDEFTLSDDFPDWGSTFLLEEDLDGQETEEERSLLIQAWRREEEELQPKIEETFLERKVESLDILSDEQDIVGLFDLPDEEGEKDETLLASLELDFLSEEESSPPVHEPEEPLGEVPSLDSITQEIQLASPAVLDLLRIEISEAYRDLSNALGKFIHATDDSAELLEAMEEYNDNVQSILDAAIKIGLKGLPQICHFITENMFELSTHPKAIRRAAQAHIESWPYEVLSYLHSPLQGAPHLIAHLSDPTWPFALDETHAQTLLTELTLGILGKTDILPEKMIAPVQTSPEPIQSLAELNVQDSKQIEEVETIPFPDDEQTTVADEVPNITLAPPAILEPLIKHLVDIEQEASEIFVKLCEAEEESEALLSHIETYTEIIQGLWDHAQQIQFEGLENLCDFINENIITISSLDRASRKVSQEVFLIWPQKVLVYLRSPFQGLGELISFLQNPLWPLPLKEPHELQQHLLEPHFQEEASTGGVQEISLSEEELPDWLAPPETIEIIIGQLADIEESLSISLEQLCKAEDGSEELLVAIENYTEHVQILWDTAGMAGLEGLQEVCALINNNITLLGTQKKSIRGASKDLLQVWPPLVLAYLQSPIEYFIFLTNHLQDSRWPLPLEDAQTLQQHLIQPIKAHSVNQEDSIQSEAFIPSVPSGIPTSNIESGTPQKAAEVEKIILADPETLDIVMGQIADLQEELSKSLVDLCEAEEGSEAILLATSAYTENVQAIWDIAEMARLEVLQELCTFINDNVMMLGGQDKSTRVAAFELVHLWPSLVMNYLKEPTKEAQTLVTHFQNSHWPLPLDEALSSSLYQRLITPSPPLVEEFNLATPDILERVRHQIITVVESLSAALEVCISMESDNPVLFEAIETYTNQVQNIWDAAETAGLVGLQEVCNFINENLMVVGMQEHAAKLTAKPYLEQWPTLVLEYLQVPLTGSKQLITFMQEGGWPQPLEPERAENLLLLLTQSSQSPQQVAAYEEEQETAAYLTPETTISELADLPLPEGSQEISLGNAEALGILTEELQATRESLDEELKKILTLSNQEAALAEATENYTDQVQRLKTAAEMLGLKGLEDVCGFIVDNVNLLSQQDQTVRGKAKKVLEAWPDLVLAYLSSPTESVIALLNHLREPQWSRPLPDNQAHELLNLLTQGSTGESELQEASAYSRPTVANPEDAVLRIPGDVNHELLQAYLSEAPQHAADFSSCIQSIIRNPETAIVERAQRIAHTLKGSSNIVGIKAVANIAHHLEDTLEYLAQHQVAPPKELTEVMVEAADCIEMMIETLIDRGEPPPQIHQVLQSVLDWANRIEKGMNTPPPPRPVVPSASPETQSVVTKPAAATTEKTQTQATGGEAGTPEQVLRVPTKTIDNLMRLVGELSISLGQIQEKLKHVLHNTRNLNEQDLLLQQKTFELENIVDVRGLAGVDRYRQVSKNDEEFDPLEFEEYNELHSVTHSFIEAIADNRELAMSIRDDLVELESMFIHQQHLSKEFESSIMTTRTVPVNTILAKLQRNVRQTCKTVGKNADLEVSGTDIMIDSDVLNNLADPLQHILRNAIDHGIETPEERTVLGKSSTGTIKLSFYREGNNIVVSCKDDGQGLNYTNIRYTAIQRGLLKENQEVTEAELARFILMSGFSTKSGVTQVSGRGVGMDVVHTNVRQMKGTLDLFSETGKGTTMVIKLPMTLVTVHVLLVRVGNRVFGIPTNNLEQALAPGVGELQKIGEEISLKVGKHIYPIKSLASLLKVPGAKEGIEEDDTRPIILAHEETSVTAMVVDELIDTHDLVMKSMGKYVKQVRGITGAAILGDGSLIPLLDLPELLRAPMQAVMTGYSADSLNATIMNAGASVPKIMIVDDSLSVRKSLALLMEDAGFEIMLAKDGLEAIEILGKNRPHVMLVDMEMPRMNGLELTSHVRANQSTQKIPIFMITSRTTEKHREQAKAAGVSAYLTKPYQDTELLGLIDKALAGLL